MRGWCCQPLIILRDEVVCMLFDENVEENEKLVSPMRKHPIREFVESIVVAIILAVFIIVFVVQGFFIPSGSMRMTLLEGDRILVNKFLYRFGDPINGDVIVFKFPPDPDRTFIKRIIAHGGQTVEVRENKLFVNGDLVEEPYLNETEQMDFGPVKVPESSYFVMGDNRNASDDSRYWGFVPRENILGKAFVIYFPIKRVGLLNDYHE